MRRRLVKRCECYRARLRYNLAVCLAPLRGADLSKDSGSSHASGLWALEMSGVPLTVKKRTPAVTSFRRRVFTIVRAIPPGRVVTYGDVARLAGFPRAARAVGNVMRACDDPSIPAHRVIAAGGALGGFGSSPQLKRQLLAAEGIALRGSRVREFRKVRWDGKRTARAQEPGRGAARRSTRV